MKKNYFAVIMIFVLHIIITNTTYAQSFAWAKQMGNVNPDQGQSIAVDGAGNVHTTGFFSSIVDFDPSAATYTLDAVNGSCFISKLDAAGNFLWAKQLVGVGYGIKVDGSGNVFTCGEFGGTGDFDPGAGTYTLASAGGSDVFISELNSAGIFVLAKNMGGSGNDRANAITIDAGGNILTTGDFDSPVADFDPGAGTYTLSVFGTSNDVFVSKLNSAGNFVWAKQMGGANLSDRGQAIATDVAGNVYSAGTFYSNAADFDPGAGTFTMTVFGACDCYVSKLNAAGNFMWAGQLGGPGADEGRGIAVDAAANVYTGGLFSGGVNDFDPGAGTYTMSPLGFNDAFVSKLNSSGNFLWAKQIGGCSGGGVFGEALALDASNNIYTTGYFYGSASDFDPGPGTYTIASLGAEDIFISKISSSGNFLMAKQLAGPNAENGLAIAVDPAGNNVYTTGTFSGTTDYDPGAGTYNLTAAGSGFTGDIFISKLTCTSNPVVNVTGTSNTICAGSSATLAATGGTLYSWSNGATTASITVNPTITTVYTAVGTNSIGCTNTSAPLTITVSPVTLSVTATNTVMCGPPFNQTITLTGSGATTYTWNTTATTSTIAVSPTVTTVYSVAGTNTAGCTFTLPITITVSALPTITITGNSTINGVSTNPIICIFPSSTVTLFGGGANTFTWSTGATTQSITLTSASYTAIGNYNYTVTGTNGNGCSNTAVITVSVYICTGINTVNQQNSEFSVYPNPNNGSFIIHSQEDLTLNIVNELGQVVKTVTLNATNDHQLIVSNLESGIYFLVNKQSGKAIPNKIVVIK